MCGNAHRKTKAHQNVDMPNPNKAHTALKRHTNKDTHDTEADAHKVAKGQALPRTRNTDTGRERKKDCRKRVSSSYLWWL